MDGRIVLNTTYLKKLRRINGLSQEKLANACCDKLIHVSISTIKRAEIGKPVLYRTAAELAKFYQVSLEALAQAI